MKTKPIYLNFKVPAKYEWVAVQPWGEINLFVKKPKIFVDPDDSNLSWWETKDVDYLSLGENEAFNNANKTDDWKNSLGKI